MTGNLSPFCVYTIVHVDQLARAHEAGGAGSFTEGKRWVTASRLFEEARAAGRRMPILFADAATTDKLLYYGFLTGVDIRGEGRSGSTHYSFEGLTPLGSFIPKSALIKMNGGKPLSDDHIRPYVICRTPDFVPATPSPEPPRGPLARLRDAVVPSGGPGKKPTAPIYLFGYSGKAMEQIERAVGGNGLLLDIRYSPRSRRPGFARAGFERVFGDRYRHVRELGNAAYQGGDIQLADPEAGLATVEALAAKHDGPIFLMCACEDGQTCHRRVVGKLLTQRGYTVKEYSFGR